MSTGPVGYLTLKPGGYEGARGSHYDYVLAGNGVFVESEGKYLAARARVTWADVRGLAPTEPKLVLRHGPIPGSLLDLALDAMLADTSLELFAAVIWDDAAGYRLHIPPQERSDKRVRYDRHPNTVFDLHSHGTMEAVFSNTDDEDEVGLGVYGVVGSHRGLMPALSLRLGVYGYFQKVSWAQVFTGTCPALDVVEDGAREPLEIFL